MTAEHNSGPSASERIQAGISRARRHTRVVRMLRVLLPASFIAIFGGYAVTVMKSAGLGSGLPELAVPRILPENLAMANPHYEGFSKDGSSYTVSAKTARQNFSDTNIIKLDGIAGTLVELDKNKTTFAAVRGDYNQKSGMLELFESITINGDSGLKAVLKSASINTKNSTINSQEPVSVAFSAGKITANTLKIRNKVHEATFAGDVAAQFVPQKPKSADGSAAVIAVGAETAATQMFSKSDAPLDITSNRLDVKDEVNTAIFTGNVIAVQNGQTLTTPQLTVLYSRDEAKSASSTPLAAMPESGNIKQISAKGPVVLERGQEDRVTAQALEYDAAANVASLIGDVVMSSGADRRANSERADMHQTDGTILLTGPEVNVQQGRNELHGRRLFINRLTGNAQLTSPPTAGAGPGRIQAKFYSGNADEKSAKKAKSEPKTGADSSAALASFKSDPSKPVDIDAEQLDVNNSAKTATFRGDVSAIQGDITIKTSEMVAHYTGDVNLADATEPKKTDAGKDKKSETELTRIEAKKNVTVTSKDGQSVQGDWATFDAKANTVVVGGEVILSKGGSMVRGSRMNIDLTSGENTIETTPGETVQLPGGGGWTTNAPAANAAAGSTNRGRPSAIFFPTDMQGAKDKKDKTEKKPRSEAKAEPAPKTGDAWSAQTAPTADDSLTNPLASPN